MTEEEARQLKLQLQAALAEIDRQKQRRAQEKKQYDDEVTEINKRYSVLVNLQESSQTSNESEVANALLSLRGVLNQNVQVINQARAAQPQHVIMPNTQSIIRNFHGTEDPENSDAWIR
ncbi:hypothetical protein TKK_0008418 [Trichogramma kaykai]|uniref:Uncharacterized protein n=1 Tax=Trichogramma kaykai TaxID=54128 RepID=A0ABD2X523_9HYME